MAVTTVRPDSTPLGSSNFAISGGAASINAALSDNNVATYITKSAAGNAPVVVGFGTTTIASNVRVYRVRIRSQVLCPSGDSRLTVTPISRVAGVNYFGSAQTFVGSYTLAEYAAGWFTVAPDGEAWDQARIDGLRAQIQDTATGAALSNIYELFFDIDTTTQPTVTVSEPSTTQTATSKPEVSWAYADTDGYEQDYYQVRVFTAAQYSISGFDPETSPATWDSDVVASGDNTVTVGDYLANATYRAYVKVAKSVSGEPFWSAWANRQWTQSAVQPTTPTVTANFLSATNRVSLAGTGASVSGSISAQVFQIQRSDNAGTAWADVRSGADLIPDGSNSVSLDDYEAPRAQLVYYRARSIGTIGDGEVASPWSASVSASIVNDNKWWFKALNDPTLNVSNVPVQTGFQRQATEQIGVFRPIGRAGAIVVSAGMQDEDGNYKFVTSSTSEFTSLWNLCLHQGTVLVQTPEPDQAYIRIVDRQYDRSNTGAKPINAVSIAYVAVDE